MLSPDEYDKEIEQLRARNAELERQLADENSLREAATSAARKFEEFMLKEKSRAEQAEQRAYQAETIIANTHTLYQDGDANIPDSICDGAGQVALGLCKVCSAAECELTERVCATTVEEAVKAEREECAPYMRHRNDEHVFCESLKSEDSPCTCGLDAIRARSGK